MMNKMLFLLLMCIGLTVQAQNITGVIRDTTSQEIVPYASVIIAYADTTDRCFSNEEGAFSFTPRQFPLKVKALIWGVTSDSICLDSFPTDHFITLSLPYQAVELEGVTVVGHERLTSLTDGGLSYRMSENERAQSENTLQSLSYVPLVNVDMNGQITVQGSSSYSLYLNGRPYEMAQTSPKAFLESLPASSISKVEVITHPTNKMGPTANQYIINIVLKKDLTDGYVINIGGGGNTQPAANGSLLGMIKKGNVDASLTYDYGLNGQRNQPATLAYSLPATEGNPSKEWETHIRGNGDWHTHTLRAMFKWQIDSLNTLYADAHGNINRTDIVSKEWSVSDGFASDHSYIDNSSKYTSGSAEANVVYRNYFATDKSKERFTLGYHFTYNPDTRHFSQHRFSENAEAIDSYQNTDGGMREHSALLSYLWQVHPKQAIRVSLKEMYRLGDTRSVYLLDEEQRSSMDYHNNIAEGNVTYSTSIGHAMIEGGVRLNHDYFRMGLPLTPENDFSNKHLYVMPSASIYWMLNSKHALYFNYATSLTRPTVQMLNPFVNVANDASRSQGNPDLKAQYTHDLSLYWIFNGVHNLSVFSGLSYFNVQDMIHNYNYLNGNNKVVSTYGNMGVGNQIGLVLNTKWNATKWLMLSVNGNAGIRYLSADGIGLNQKDWYYNLSPECNLLLPKHYRLGINGGFYNGLPNPWTDKNTLIMYSFNASKSFLKGRLNVSMMVNSPFSKYHKSIEDTRQPTLRIKQTNFITARSFGIRLSYSFGSGQKVDIERDRIMQSTDQVTGVN